MANKKQRNQATRANISAAEVALVEGANMFVETLTGFQRALPCTGGQAYTLW